MGTLKWNVGIQVLQFDLLSLLRHRVHFIRSPKHTHHDPQIEGLPQVACSNLVGKSLKHTSQVCTEDKHQTEMLRQSTKSTPPCINGEPGALNLNP